jgi:hypothetical protein
MLPSWSTGRWLLFPARGHVADVIGKYAAIDRFFDQRHPVLQGSAGTILLLLSVLLSLVDSARKIWLASARVFLRPAFSLPTALTVKPSADVNQADLVFIRRAAVVTQLAVRVPA